MFEVRTVWHSSLSATEAAEKLASQHAQSPGTWHQQQHIVVNNENRAAPSVLALRLHAHQFQLVIWRVTERPVW